MRALTVVSSIVAVVLWVAPAAAQSADARASAAARHLFQRGLACVDREDWQGAVEAFGRARDLHPSTVILTNHAVALQHVGRLVEASEAYRQILRDPGANEAARRTAQEGLRDVEPRLAHLTVHVEGSTDGAIVLMDGAQLDRALWGVSMPVDPGAHRLEAQRGATIVTSAEIELRSRAEAQTRLHVPAPLVASEIQYEGPAPVLAPGSVVASMHATGESEALGGPSVGAITSDAARPEHHEVYEEWWFWTLVGVAIAGAGVGTTIAVLESQSPQGGASGTLGTIDVRP
ncbi:MAG: hypothetical protein J0L92_25415 [Deltaproteobacteria bacterium]|nr:hypothetical protein [Deltaproteobacteria bacterium]